MTRHGKHVHAGKMVRPSDKWPSMWADVKTAADRLGITVQDACRQALHDWIRRNK